MKADEAPEKIYVHRSLHLGLLTAAQINITGSDIEYTRTDAFIEKACKFLYNYNQKQVLKHGPKATLGCGEYTINVEDFRNYMKGE